MNGSRPMVDTQSPIAEIRRGKKEERKKERKKKEDIETTGQKYNGLALFHTAAITRQSEIATSSLVCTI